MLPCQSREPCRGITSAGGRVAGRAGRHVTLGNTAAIDRLAQRQQFRIGLAAGARLGRVIGGYVRQVLVGLAVQLARHGWHRAGAIANILQLLVQVLLTLAGQLGKGRHRAVSVGAMAGGADHGLGFTRSGIAGRHGFRGISVLGAAHSKAEQDCDFFHDSSR